MKAERLRIVRRPQLQGTPTLAELIRWYRDTATRASARSARLVAEVLQQNARMLRLAERFGFRRQDAQFGTVRLVLELRPVADAPTPGAIGRETQPASLVTSRLRAP